MAKQGERDYFRNLGDAGVRHANQKPFSDEACGKELIGIGAIMSLLPPPPCRLLDLGCGTGWTSLFFAKAGWQVVGADISEDGIRHAQAIQLSSGIKNLSFVVADFENLTFDNEFDCAVFYDSLHHSENEDTAIERVFEALRSGGVCVLSEPGKGHSKTATSIDAVRRFQVTEKDMPPTKIIKLAKSVGFSKYRIYPSANYCSKRIFNPSIPEARQLILNPMLLRQVAKMMGTIMHMRNDGIVLLVK